MVQVGGTIGAFTLGWFVHKWGFVPVLTTCGVLASINIAAIGQPWIPLAMLATVVFIAGVCVVGGQAAINALAATYYPTELRSTGIGAGLGVGRMGAIIGPTHGERAAGIRMVGARFIPGGCGASPDRSGRDDRVEIPRGKRHDGGRPDAGRGALGRVAGTGLSAPLA